MGKSKLTQGAAGSLRVTADGKIYKTGKRTYANYDVYEGEFVDGLRHGSGQMMMFASKDIYTGEFHENLFHGYGVYTWGPFYDDNKKKITSKRYEGGFKDGLRHGKGVLILGNGDSYAGEFERNNFHGEGILRLKSDDVFSGSFRVGKPSGKMKIDYASGDGYEGELKLGKYHGTGKLVYHGKKGTYEGEWSNGLSHGKGSRMYCNGSKYVGEFLNGEIHGNGIMYYVNGDQYVGELRFGHLHGKGCYAYAFGDRYEGGFMHGAIHGEGKYTFADGGYYIGEYMNTKKKKLVDGGGEFHIPDGIRHGFGIRVFLNGNKYEGKWVNGNMDSEVALYHKAEGSKYEGGFRNNQRYGQGREEFGNVLDKPFTCPMGHRHKGQGYCVYTGKFARDFFHGQGEFVCCDGRKYIGEWKNGTKDGCGRYYYLRDGDIGDLDRYCIGGNDSMYRVKEYSGDWKENIREGKGIITYVNGDKVEGDMVKGQLHGTCQYHFAGGGDRVPRMRYALYTRGTRIEFMDQKVQAAKDKILKTMMWMAREEEVRKVMEENPEYS